ncbi:MAG: hypothetical protein GY775_15850 [Candidatus Scalindua sp.]|nr:hypothetical protein [Candidatus Scalindua sp.]
MVKHLLSEKDAGKNVIHNGRTYRSVGRVVELPEAVAMYNPTEEEIKRDWKADAIDAGLEGEELKKFMGKNKALRQKQLDKLKG